MSQLTGAALALADPLGQYKRTEIETAPPLKLLLMLYDAAIARCESGADAIRGGKPEAAHRELIKAQDILTELMVSLDPGAGGAPVRELFALYEYMHRLLVRANVHKETAPVEEAARILSDLRGAWALTGSSSGEDDGDVPPPPPARPGFDIEM